MSESERVGYLQRARALLKQEGTSPSDCIVRVVSSRVRMDLAMQNSSKAIAEANRFLEMCGEDPFILFQLGQTYQNEEQWDRAIAAWRKAGALAPLRELGDRLAHQRLWNEALLAYSAVLESKPTDCIYLSRAATATWFARQDLTGAMSKFTQASSLCPDLIDSYVAASRVLLEARNYVEAERWAKQGCQVDPSSELPFNILALVQLRQNHAAESLPFLRTALLLNPRSGEAHGLLGVAYIQLSSFRSAVDELKLSISFGPEQSWYYETLGFAYEALGDRINAIAAYQETLKMDPRSQTAQNRLMQLEKSR